jgi:hypothetical protein
VCTVTPDTPRKDEIIRSVEDWGQQLEGTFGDNPPAKAAVAALAKGVAVVVLLGVEGTADWNVGTWEIRAQAAAHVALKTMGDREQELAEEAGRILLGPAEKVLASDPRVIEVAKQVGLTAPADIARVARQFADKHLPELIDEAREQVPRVLEAARQEPWASLLEKKLAQAGT